MVAKVAYLIRVALVDEAIEKAMRDAGWMKDGEGMKKGIEAVQHHLRKLIQNGTR